MEELKRQQPGEADGGKWQPEKCTGYVVGVDHYNGYPCIVYVTSFGDTLSQIACSLADGNYEGLARFNGISDPDRISVNQTIYVPVGAYNA